jgi:hypothetical protein
MVILVLVLVLLAGTAAASGASSVCIGYPVSFGLTPGALDGPTDVSDRVLPSCLTLSTDTLCAPGTFLMHGDCIEATQCHFGMCELSPPTVTSDRVCGSVRV